MKKPNNYKFIPTFGVIASTFFLGVSTSLPCYVGAIAATAFARFLYLFSSELKKTHEPRPNNDPYIALNPPPVSLTWQYNGRSNENRMDSNPIRINISNEPQSSNKANFPSKY